MNEDATATAGEQAKQAITFGRLRQKLGEVIIEVKLLDSEEIFEASFEDMDPVTEREFKTTANRKARGGVLSQRSFDDALINLFKKKFKSTNIPGKEELREFGFETEKDFFLRDEMGQRYMMSMANEYRQATQIDAEHSKN